MQSNETCIMEYNTAYSKIWDLIRSGDRAAFNQLYDKYANMLFDYGMKLISNDNVVEESIQSVFIDLYQRQSKLPKVESPKAYLFKAMKNTVLMHYRKTKTKLKREIDGDISELSETYNFELELDVESDYVNTEYTKNLFARLQDILDNLPNRQKEAIYLKYYSKLSGEEIADIMGVRHQSVRSILTLARQQIKKELHLSISLLAIILFYGIVK